MRAVIQRVKKAQVLINGQVFRKYPKGCWFLLVLESMTLIILQII